ncbi:MAG TPA: VWA domain-containing protein [Pyrinomonadaceae bacterium]
MRSPKALLFFLLLIAALFCLSVSHKLQAQTVDKPQKNSTGQADEVVRITTELVQTDVTVLDRQGRFVEGLKQEQFELSVEGKPQSLSFFEPVLATSAARDGKAARGDVVSTIAAVGTPPARRPSERGRSIFFFVDDVHLAPENLARARKSLLNFIGNEMKQHDQVAVVSTSGQVGFLQQLTNNQAVLREAVARLNNRRNPETHAGKVRISEYDAAQVSEHFNRELFTYLVAATAAEFQTDMETAANMVRNRVHQIGAQSRTATVNTLSALLGLIRSSAPLPGRKIVFFITDGFIADPRASNVLEVLRQITKTAAQVGAVIYSMDARGVFADSSTDAGRNDYPDFTGSVSRNLLGETTATQEPLQILAADTGGRAFLNSNSFEDGFARALDESSSYYLLAWRPARETEREGKARIAVSIKGRPDLKVRLRRGFIEAPKVAVVKRPASEERAAAPGRTPDDELRAALASLYPLRALPVALSAGYVNTAKGGTVLQASMQIDTDALRSDPERQGQRTEVDVLGVAIDDRGALSSFKQKVTIDPEAKTSGNRAIVWNQQLPLAPGLYQVRVAVRERETGRVGTMMQWLEVPDLASGRLHMSSLFLGERKAETTAEKYATAPRALMVSVDRRFARSSVLRFQTYIYNATRETAAPDVEIQARVLRNDAPVMVLPPAKLPLDTTPDRMRLPFWSEIALDRLPPGRYVLRISATNHRTKETAVQQTDFIVE